MKKPYRAFVVLALSVLFIVLTLMNKGHIDRAKVDPEWSSYATGTVKAWGWPFLYYADNPQKDNFGQIGIEDKIIPIRLLINFTFIFVLMNLALGILNFTKSGKNAV